MQVIPKTEAEGLSSIIDNLNNSARTPATYTFLGKRTIDGYTTYDTTVLDFQHFSTW